MNKRVKQNIEALINLVRFGVFCGDKIEVHGRQFLSPKCDVQVDKKAKLVLAKWVEVEKGTLIAVRENATLLIGKSVYVNRNCNIVTRNKIIIGDNVTIGPGCNIYDHDHNLYQRGEYTTSPVIIQENTWIGSGVTILKGVTIGKNVVIAAGCVVTQDVPDDMIVYQKRNTVMRNKNA